MKKINKIKLPDKPGVYLFKKNTKILYIGKATSLRNRVKSYFGKDLIETRGPLLVDMVFKANRIDYQATDSVLEALVLEANLIKKYQPYYNTKEKDDKSFNYVCITKPHLRHGVNGVPKVIIMRGKNIKHQVFDKKYGPYTSGIQLKEALKIIRPIFPFLDDKTKNYYVFYKQVDLVPDISNKEGIYQYKNNIKNLKLFFEGKKKKVLKNLEKEMNIFAKKHEFENAGKVKKQIFAIKHINDIALMKNSLEPRISHLEPVFRIEAYDIAHLGGKNMVGAMVVLENGEAIKNEYKKFKVRTQNNANDTGSLKEVIERRLAHLEWKYPNLIVVDGGIAQINVAKNILKKMNIEIPIVSVVKNEQHKPKAIMGLPAQAGDEKFSLKHKTEILFANSEAHRFTIAYHKNLRQRNFL